MTTDKVIFQITDPDLNSMSANQLGIETTSDPVAGFKMMGYKDEDGTLRRALCKDQAAVVSSVNVHQDGLGQSATDIIPADSAGVINSNTSMGSPVGGVNIFGVSKDTANNGAGVAVVGILDTTTPGTVRPAVSIGGSKSDGSTNTAPIDNTSIVARVHNDGTPILDIYGNGDVVSVAKITAANFETAGDVVAGNVDAAGTVDAAGGFFVNGVPLTEGIQGSGTTGTIPIFTASEAIDNSTLTQDANGHILDSGETTPGNLYTYTVYSSDKNGARGVRVNSKNSADNDMSIGIWAWGGNYFPGSASGPDGATVDDGVQIQAEGADWIDITTLNPSAKGHLSHRWQTRLSWTDVGVGLQNQTPAGIFHPKKDTRTVNNSQLGMNYNVGPTANYVTKILDFPMVHLADTVSISQATQIEFKFNPQTLVGCMIGHGTLHYWDRRNGDSYSCHFTLRGSAEASMTVTLDYGDVAQFPLVDAGDGIRILTTNVGTIAPILIFKAVGMGSVYELSYDIHLRRVVFNTGT